ncbi:sarcosine oxidase subunit gamma [Novosphingobium sp. Rr 2-17]|uniref:sarcosine oxidase subunit gamma n=1 Tax=Novosphingobium sp. Rr 2-17 TaxID=555793 RepID=UPI0002699863|nr:sarcosine oxidase subunit gamma family protein [Novosphingobium sp. Rr 2-17]EIZ79207.1 sarcosine oxidase subunit gamma [Novosphingobium sp. Rr 2-17]
MAEGLVITQRDGLALATVMARKGIGDEAIGARLGLVLPLGPAFVSDGRQGAVGLGPGAWLVMQDAAEASWAEDLAANLEWLAAVSDQSSGYIVFRIAGPSAPALLQRGLSIDLHPDAFPSGSAATSSIAHIGVIVWRVDDGPTYDIAVFRSFAVSFRHWLDETTLALAPL